MEHRPQEVLASEIAEAQAQIKLGGRYAHYKDSSNQYVVTGFAVIEETEEIAVIYQADYGEKLSFIRPVAVWMETVEWQGKTVPRFTPVGQGVAK